MSQNRDAPAFQEYAAAMLAKLPFRKMTLHERGLLYTMRLECWVNERLPANHADLAKVLGVPITEIAASLAAVMPFFKGLADSIISPELEDYRAHLADRREKQSQGGKVGSAITNRKRNNKKDVDDEMSSATSSNSRASRDSLAQSSAKQPSQNQSIARAVLDEPFVAAYEAFEAESCTAEAYAKASGAEN